MDQPGRELVAILLPQPQVLGSLVHQHTWLLTSVCDPYVYFQIAGKCFQRLDSAATC